MSLFGGIDIPGCPDLDNIRRLDIQVLPTLRRMQQYGIEINREHFHALTSRFSSEMVELEKDITSYIPAEYLHEFSLKSTEAEKEAENEGEDVSEFNAASAEQIGKLLFDILGVGSEKKLKKTKGSNRVSTGKKQLEMIQMDHPVVRKILDYRERAKLVSTYTKPLPRLAKFHPHGDCWCGLKHPRPSWRVHTTIPSTRTTTGRLASRGPNLMNISGRTEMGLMIRAGFVAGEGNVLISSDLSQIELRGVAHSARADSMIRIYEQGGDIHTYTAMKAFDIDDPAKVDKLRHRLPSKTLGFGMVYGLSSQGLQMTLATMGLYWDEAQCDKFIEKFFNVYPEIQEYMSLQHYRARRYGMVWDSFGRVRLIPEVKSAHRWIREAGLRQAGNLPIQSLAAGQFKLGVARIDQQLTEYHEAGMWCWPLLPIHDELISEVAKEHADVVAPMQTFEMSNCMTDVETGQRRFRVQIESNTGVMDYWKKD